MSVKENLKQKIKHLMKSKGISYYELANKSELTEATIRNWYTKRNYTPSLDAIEKIAKAFDISIGELFYNDEEYRFLSKEQIQLLNNWSALSERQKKCITLQIDLFLEKEV